MNNKSLSIKDLLQLVNSKMHEGTSPTAGSLGQCTIIWVDPDQTWRAVLYIWDDAFNDSAQVAQWFHDAGAEEVYVTHVLHDSVNDDRDGRCCDGGRAWWVYFNMPDQTIPNTRAYQYFTREIIDSDWKEVTYSEFKQAESLPQIDYKKVEVE